MHNTCIEVYMYVCVGARSMFARMQCTLMPPESPDNNQLLRGEDEFSRRLVWLSVTRAVSCGQTRAYRC